VASWAQRLVGAVVLVVLAVVGVVLVSAFLVVGAIILLVALVLGLLLYVRFRLALRSLRRRAQADLEAAMEEARRRGQGGPGGQARQDEAIDAPFRVEDR
jgi:Flp pilus assembly protein TadB